MTPFYDLIKSVVATQPNTVVGCAIAFDLNYKKYNSENCTSTYLYPYAFKSRGLGGTVNTTDLSCRYNYKDITWFKIHSQKASPPRTLHREMNQSMDNRGRQATSDSGDGINRKGVSPLDGYWSPPYYNCEFQVVLIEYSVPFYLVRDNNAAPAFK